VGVGDGAAVRVAEDQGVVVAGDAVVAVVQPPVVGPAQRDLQVEVGGAVEVPPPRVVDVAVGERNPAARHRAGPVAGGQGGGGQGGLESGGHRRVEHRVQVCQVPDAGDAHRPLPGRADLGLVAVAVVHLGQRLAEHCDLGGSGPGGRLDQGVLVA
jgi:hypothetical protein